MCDTHDATINLENRDMVESQRSFELRKVFSPEQLKQAIEGSKPDDTLNSDGALNAYAETVLWRLRGVHCMISLIDRGHQWFLAGALRKSSSRSSAVDDDEEVEEQEQWFGCSSVPTPGGLCENTLALDNSEEYPCFTVDDLSLDPRFKDLPVINGEICSYRFYAGTPITTENGVNIGSFFMFDDKPRAGLSLSHRKFLHQQAASIMKHLTTKREAAERRRAALMSKGIADFLDRTAKFRDTTDGSSSEGHDPPSTAISAQSVVSTETSNIVEHTDLPDPSPKRSVLDRIRMTLDQAAEILRDSLGVTAGGVILLDTSLANSEVEKINSKDVIKAKERQSKSSKTLQDAQSTEKNPTGSHSPSRESANDQLGGGLTRSAEDKYGAPKVLADAVADPKFWDPKSGALTSKTLANMIQAYPKGNVWSIDEDGYFSSWQQINDWEYRGAHTALDRRNSISTIEHKKQQREAWILSQTFPKARQIIFLPLWDSGASRWFSGCFIWTHLSIPVFSVETELTYLSAFTNSMMVEISRLDAVIANKMKSDFLGSISHEFRSPLHGILVSTEFLRDSALDGSQSELVATIQNCSGTLLDTINHVLDYSKINSFEIANSQEGPVSSQLYQVTNLALLCESVVEGMVAANSFRLTSLDAAPVLSSLSEAQSPIDRRGKDFSGPEVILDIEQRDWTFKVEAGALQRIIMNLVGNAQKFTVAGYILIQVRMFETNAPGSDSPDTTLALTIKDSGKGMSTEFMERKLYHPFAQEDSFVPGVGLGLSIVWSIIDQLSGKIKVHSEIGKGTEVEVRLPVEKSSGSWHPHMKPGDTVILPDAEQCIARLRERAKSMTISIFQSPTDLDHKKTAWASLECYLLDWFGFKLGEASADIIITDRPDQGPDQVQKMSGQRILLVYADPSHQSARNATGIASISNPIGPYKLARAVLSLLDQDLYTPAILDVEMAASRSDVSTQTPVGSPEERTILNGIIMTDYGFSTPATSYTSSKPSQTPGVPFSGSEENKLVDHPSVGPQRDSGLTLRLPNRKATHLKTPSIPSVVESPSTTVGSEISPQNIPLPSSPTRSTFTTGTNTPSRSTKQVARSLRILAVDDNALNLQLLYRFLNKRKQDKTVTAINGLEALEAVRKAGNEEAFDVVFMDISMPVMDGFEATRLIRSFERSLRHRETDEVQYYDSASPPSGDLVSTKAEDVAAEVDVEESQPKGAYIVALTGLASRRDRDEAEQSGFDDFLTKPISFKRIGELLDRLGAEVK